MAKKRRTAPKGLAATKGEPDLSHIPEPIRGLAVPIDSIRPAAKNPVDHDEQNIEAIMASLREFGQMVLIDVNVETGEIVKGNGTHEAAKRLGWSHLAVLFVKLDPARQHAFAVADNRVAEFARWNDDVLTELSAYIERDVPELFSGLHDALLLDELIRTIDPIREDETNDEPVQEAQQKISFYFHDEEDWRAVHHAVETIKASRAFKTPGTDGRALAAICRRWLDDVPERDSTGTD